GFTNTEAGATWGTVIKNPSTDTDALDVEVKANLLGDDGDIVDTESEDLQGIPAGAAFNVGGEADTDGDKVRRIRITVTAKQGAPGGQLKLPEATHPKVVRNEFAFKVRVQIHNTLEKPLSSISDVYAVLRGEDGRIVGGVSGYPESDIAPGDSAAVELI